MNKTAIIVTYKLNHKLTITGDYIGVEQGINYLLDNDIKITAAMCDLDSVKDQVKRNKILTMKNFIHKTDQIITDGEYAIKWALKNNYQKILLFCGGTRIDMDIHTFNLVLNYDIEAIINGKHLLKKMHKGINCITPLDKDASFTMFAFKESIINIKNAVYNVDNYIVKKYDTRLVSNYFIGKQSINVEVLTNEPEIILISSKEQ